ncbi:hypothetical protein D3C75_1346380 [compost metagenome]
MSALLGDIDRLINSRMGWNPVQIHNLIQAQAQQIAHPRLQLRDTLAHEISQDIIKGEHP